LLKIVQHFTDATNVWLEAIPLRPPNGILYIYDERGQLAARTLLGYVNPEQARQLKEELAAQSARRSH
jgi:hypothetical protein